MVDVKNHDIDKKIIPLSSGRMLTKQEAMKVQKQSIAALTVRDADSPLILLHGSLPRYPVRLWTRKIEGVVEISFTIDERGRVRNPEVVSSTNRLLTKVCIRAVSRWRFEPIYKAGVPIQIQMIQKFPFKIIRQ
jgi:TonB family protein